jgi:hypothetical protein
MAASGFSRTGGLRPGITCRFSFVQNTPPNKVLEPNQVNWLWNLLSEKLQENTCTLSIPFLLSPLTF